VELDSDAIHANLRQCLFNQGSAVIGHTRVRNRQCLKFTCMNPTVTENQMEALVRMVVDQGRKIEVEFG
jgi:L-2,4-diaminobutyrate decarboxylase